MSASTDGPETDVPEPEAPGSDGEVFDEVREAAGAVIASLKQLIDATERVVSDPAAFASAVDGGRSIVDAFVGGFTAQADPEAADDDEAAPDPTTTEGSESATES